MCVICIFILFIGIFKGTHLDNHRSWMEIVNQYQERIKFEGIAITGWQRYDHFSVLCELLPVGLPSLAFNLHYLNSGISQELI